jgi:hypothetical protein
MVRGAALVERVIDSLAEDTSFRPQPVPSARLAALTFPGAAPLPPSVRRWLAFDGAWLGWFEDPSDPRFRPRKLSALVEEELEGWGYAFEGVEKKLLSGDCYLLDGGSDSRRLLYVGKADSLAEYPVLYVDVDDLPGVGLYAPGFDVYLAEWFGVLKVKRETYDALAQHPDFAASMAEQARLNLDGKTDFDSLEYDDG